MAGAGLLLGWVGLVMQHELSPAVAGGTIAAIASLPQGVSYFFWASSVGKHVNRLPFVVPALTLIGIGAAGVILLYRISGDQQIIQFREGSWVELLALLLVCFDAFWMVVKRTISLWDTIVLLATFSLYIIFASRLEPAPPHREGPLSEWRHVPAPWRQVYLVLLGSAAAILLLLSWKDMSRIAAFSGQGPRAHWVNALIDESPILLTALLLAAQNWPRLALRVLVAGLVVQTSCWVGLIPLGPVLAHRAWAFALSEVQISGLIVYAAMLFYVVLLLSGLAVSLAGGFSLAGLFLLAFLLEGSTGSWIAAGLILLSCVALVLSRRRAGLPPLVYERRAGVESAFSVAFRNFSSSASVWRVLSIAASNCAGGK